jgi:hypothetical protein
MKNTTEKNSSVKIQQQSRFNFKGWMLRIIYSLIILYGIIWAASPFAFRYFLQDWLTANYQLQLSDSSSIRYNPFTSHLTINELSVTKKDKVLFSLNNLDVEIRLHRLLFKQLYISEFGLDGIFVAIKKDAEAFEIAGVDINKIAQSDTIVVQQPKPEKKSSFQIISSIVNLNNSKVSLRFENSTHEFRLKQLQLSNVNVSEAAQSLKLSLLADLDQAPINLSLIADLNDYAGGIKTEFAIQNFSLKNIKNELNKDILVFDGSLSFETSAEITLSKTESSIALPKAILELKMLDVETKDIKIKQDFQKILFQKVQYAKNKDDKNKASIENITWLGESLLLTEKSFDLNSLKQILSINNFRYISDEDEHQSKLDSINLTLSEFKGNKDNLDFENDGFKINLNQLSMNAQKIAIESLFLDGLNGKFILRKLKDSTLKINPTNSAPSNSKKGKVKAVIVKSEDDKLQFYLKQFAMINSKPIVFIDENAQPSFTNKLLIEEMKISNLTSSQPNKKSTFVINGVNNQYSKFKFSGFIKPFTPKINLKILGEIAEISLPPLNSYVNQMLGFEFGSGSLDLNIDVAITDSEIAGNTVVFINGFELASAENYNQNVIQEQTSLPLNVALGMLKDDNGNVKIDIPMLGNIESPSFGISSFFALITKNAIQTAAKSYLIKTFIPYAELLSITISAGDFILKTRFEDLIFQNRQIQISATQEKFMNQFVELMKAKPATKVKVCAVSSIEELSSQQLNNLDKAQQVLILKELANKRMNTFKHYSDSHGIETSRILLCSPQVDFNQNSQSRIQLSAF